MNAAGQHARRMAADHVSASGAALAPAVTPAFVRRARTGHTHDHAPDVRLRGADDGVAAHRDTEAGGWET